MADRYWVGGTASWDGTAGTKWALTSGGAGGQAIPTSADDVFFDAASGAVTCTIATGNTGAKSINCTGFTGTLTVNSNITFSGSITLVSGMTYNYTSGNITISGTGTVITAGKALGETNISGVGITVTLGDPFTNTARGITISAGTFDTAGYAVTASNFTAGQPTAKTINLNASTITLSNVFTLPSTTLTFNAGTSQINCTNASPAFTGGNQTFNNVSFTNTALAAPSIDGANTFNNLTFAARAASGIGTLSLAANQTINGTLTVQSGATDPTRRLFIRSNTIGTARTITSAANSIFGADFRDITAAGAASWTDSTRTGYWGDCKGNTGITFDTAKNRYWNLSGAQNWSATGWAASSGGSPAIANFPLAQDTAIFDNAGSVTGTITINFGFNLGTVDMSNRTSAMTLSFGIASIIYGNWTNGSGTTLAGANSLTFGGRTTQTITSASKTFSNAIIIDSPSGTVQLADDITLDTARTFTLTRGTFDASNYNVSTGLFSSASTATRTITMGSGLWTLSGTGVVWNIDTTNLTFNKDTANIILSDTSTSARTFAGGGLTYNKLTIGGATGTSTLSISGINTFSELASTKTVAHTISFGVAQTITTWSVTGTSGNVVTVSSSTQRTTRTLTITNRTSGIDYLDVQDITAPLAPVTFYAGANTLLRSNVQGVAAKAPVTDEFIYVLNTGTSFTVPANWNNSDNEIHLFAGGGGAAGARASVDNRAGGGGGGGGGYTKVTNLTLTPSSSVSYAIGAAGGSGAANNNGTAGGNTTFNAGTYTTTGGGGGQATTTPTSTGGTAGTGSTFNGGVGGAGSTSTAASTGNGGGGGAGSGGPLGAGADGGAGASSTTQDDIAGGGGGGNGGGTTGANASSPTGGNGGNNNAGVGGGAGSTGAAIGGSGFNGGGGGGGGVQGGYAGSGIDIVKASMGSGGGAGGGGGLTNNVSLSGLFGGGGGGGSVSTAAATRAGGGGGQGGIIIVYNTGAAPSASNGNFFFLFG